MGVTEVMDFKDTRLLPGVHCPGLAEWFIDSKVGEELRVMGRSSEMPCHMSDGTLGGLKKLRIQKHCVIRGLQLVHADGSVETLGHWDPEDLGSVSEIYDAATDGQLRGIEFRTHEMRVNDIVIDILEEPGSVDQTLEVSRRDILYQKLDNAESDTRVWPILPQTVRNHLRPCLYPWRDPTAGSGTSKMTNTNI